MENTQGETKPSCPTEKGFRNPSLFHQPGFNFGDIWEHPDIYWHVIGWIFSILFVITTLAICLTLITKHLRNYYKPRIQQHKLRILLYPPMYSLLAWFSFLRPDYATTILFFATIFEAFAKEPIKTKVFCCIPFRIKSKWGMHFRVIVGILVIQFPIWSIIKSLISLISQSQGYYCESGFNFKGAHVYLVLINFVSLSFIIITLFIYLAVYSKEFKQLQVPSHGMFWTIKLPILIEFYIGSILLSILKYVAVIKAKKTGNHELDHEMVEQIKMGLESIITCFVMCVSSFMMVKYYNLDRDISKVQHDNGISNNYIELPVWFALMDAYFYYIPEFIRQVYGCGTETYQLARKRRQIIKNKRKKISTTNNVNDVVEIECHVSLKNDNVIINNTNPINNMYPPALAPNINTITTNATTQP
ncbi:hypothetical protein BJ944DRAFT_179416 [Cunninghamella echinulata]|nr:hypothetical protein BJ944DRAFT_179416 [Cunninghamella echinulata]